MSKNKKEKSETLCEVLRINIKDINFENKNTPILHYLVDTEEEKENLPRIDIDETNNSVLQSNKAVCKNKVLVNESELIRILKAVNPINIKCDGNDYPFVRDLIILKVGKNTKKYENLIDNQYAGTIYFNNIPYIRLICASGHNRSKKIMMVRKQTYDIIYKIGSCGIDNKTKFLDSKFNAYFGLMASDSKVVSLPNIVVINDFEMPIKDTYDIVDGNISKSEYTVKIEEKEIKIKAFDGAGLVDISKATKWAEELGLDYIPASWQFRCIPAIKGNLYTFDIKKFSEIYGKTEIIDIGGKVWDLNTDEIDCIMTKSQFKFASIYLQMAEAEGDIKQWFDIWQTNFSSPVEINDGITYQRTFNISEYAVACNKPSENSKSKILKDSIVMCYQPLQTLDLSDDEIKSLCKLTVEGVEKLHTNVDDFLDYRGVPEDEYDDWKSIPSYYQALRFNHSLYNDGWIKSKIAEDIKSIKQKAYTGKIRVLGNYQTLTPDIFGLAQYAFGMNVTGLLDKDEIFSNYWNNKQTKTKEELVYVKAFVNQTEGFRYFPVETFINELDLIRLPHIANEHCPVKVKSNSCLNYWFKYQQTGYLLSIHDTNMLKMNSADTDGDHIAGIYQQDIIAAAKRCKSKTIDFVQLKDDDKKENKENDKKVAISDIVSLMKCDLIGFKNDIGTVVNNTSILWSVLNEADDKAKVEEYIKIMSVIDSLVIDFVKTGEKAEIPKNILSLLKDYKKPYFMRYLKKKSATKEKYIKNNIKRYNKIDVDFEAVSQFSRTNCTMNKICWYLEEQFNDLKVGFSDNENEFDYTSIINGNIDNKSELYKIIKNKLIELQQEMYQINNVKYKDEEDKEQQKDYNSKYNQFFNYVKCQLLTLCNDINMLLDYIIYMFYTEKYFESNNNKSILWNSFAKEMIKRCTGKNIKPIDDEVIKKLPERAEKLESKINDKKQRQKVKIIPIDNIPDEIKISNKSISKIKKIIKTDIKYFDEVRRYFFVLLVMYLKLNIKGGNKKPIIIKQNQKKQINYNQVAKLADIDQRHFTYIIDTLVQLKLITLDISKLAEPKIYVNFDNDINDTDDCKIIKEINDCKTHLSQCFAYSGDKKFRNLKKI